MSKYRIYDLAKEFKTDSKTVLNILKTNNVSVKSHASTVGDDERKIVEKNISAKKTAAKGQKVKTVSSQEKNKANISSKNKVSINKVSTNKEKTASEKYKNGLTVMQKQHNEKKPVNRGNDNIETTAKKQANATTAASKKNRNSTTRQGHEKFNRDAQTSHTGHTSRQRRDNTTSSRNDSNKTPNDKNTNSRTNSNNRANTNSRTNNNSKNKTGMNSRNNTGSKVNNNNNNRNSDSRTNNTTNRSNSNNNSSNKANFNNRKNNNFSGNKHNSRRNWKNSRNRQQLPKQEIVRPKVIKVGESISVKELASKMTYTVTDVIKKLMMLGIMATINQEIDFDTAVLVAAEFNISVEELPPEVDLTEIPEIDDSEKDLLPRPPVVTVMGHVDHGKTSLLDVIRKTSVTSNEAGGITQHIGAYQVMCKNKKIVFLDTPGHEAFTAMRARGAQVTDIAVLVVAADDGVMPQTLEAINHAKDAKVPIVVAINKIDKPGANPEHVKQQLAEHELIPEDWGGDTIMVPVSAKKKLGINDLLEMILLVAEMQELKANPNRDARGIIIEAQLDKGRGPVATILVQNGTLHIGDSIIAGTTYGKVRAMINDRGEKIKKAGPSVPVEVLGLSDVPAAGDEIAALDEHLARTISEKRVEKQRTELINNKKVSLDDLFEQINEGNIKDLNILLKADVQGSVEALKTSLLGLNKSDEVRVSIVHAGVGAVNESDVMLASAANALILAFNVRPDANARKLADTESIDIRTYRVIYEAINDIEAAMKGMLAPKYKEVIQGKVEIRQVMKFSKALVAGSYVLEGKITNTSQIRVIRDNVVVYEGKIESLRRFKDDVKEVAAGYECGITMDNYRNFKEKDIIEAYTMEEIAPQSL
ncbi:translation initiation factor IF-2 [Pectinatus sottacetonis]|uniref:translation initiation factor IF-2 n=1 Tax=Pectinatus sottacetonis TaxID=1002795 RepID=UPI0018C54558|nr:translation initiation factor IF-2 [Pectinatus sottacetonis]